VAPNCPKLFTRLQLGPNEVGEINPKEMSLISMSTDKTNEYKQN